MTTTPTHIVKRDSGYVAGWFASQAEAEAFAVECNATVPGDPARVIYLDPAEWDALIGHTDCEPVCIRCHHPRREHAAYVVAFIGKRWMECRTCECDGYLPAGA